MDIPNIKTAADAFDWMRSGRGEFDPAKANEAQLQAARQAALNEAQLVFDVMTTGRGPEFLEWLRERTIEVPLLNVSRSLVAGEVALSPADWAYFRGGQNSIVHMIEEKLALVRQQATENANEAVYEDTAN